MSDQSGRLLGLDFSFSKVSFPLFEIGFLTKSFGASKPGLQKKNNNMAFISKIKFGVLQNVLTVEVVVEPSWVVAEVVVLKL